MKTKLLFFSLILSLVSGFSVAQVYTKKQVDDTFVPQSYTITQAQKDKTQDDALTAKETVTNKVNTLSGGSSTQYPSVGAVMGKFYGSATGSNDVIKNMYLDQTRYDLSPVSGTWLDAAAFAISGTPSYETTTNFGSTYSAAVLPRKLFQHKLDEVVLALTNTAGLVNGFRLTYGAVFGASYLQWMKLTYRFPYSAGMNVLVEYSNDGTNWITSHTSSATTSSGFTVGGDYYKLSLPPSGSYSRYRITLTVNQAGAAGAVSNLTGLQLLTLRTGDSGSSYEKQVPYGWDENRNLMLVGSTTTPVSSSATRGKTDTRQQLVAIDGLGRMTKTSLPTGVIVGANSDGGLQSIWKSSVAYPLTVDKNKQITIAQLDRSAVAVDPASRLNLAHQMSYTGGTSATYGMASRQVANDTLIKPAIVNGKQSIRFSLHRWQTAPLNERSELSGNALDTGPFEQSNRTRWMGIATYLPADFISDNQSVQPIVFQWHDSNNYSTFPAKSGRVPCLAMAINSNHWNFHINYDTLGVATGNAGVTNKQIDLGPVAIGQFTRWTVNVKWSTNKANGYVKVWKNDSLVVDYVGANAYNDIGTGLIPYFKMGIYNWAWPQMPAATPPTRNVVVHHADWRYGDSTATYADVTPDRTYNSNNQFLYVNTRSDSAYVDKRFTNGTTVFDNSASESSTSTANVISTANSYTTSGSRVLSVRYGNSEFISFGKALGSAQSGTLGTIYMPGNWNAIHSGGRLDIFAPASNIWVQSADLRLLNTLLYFPPPTVATSTATQITPSGIIYGNSLWNGTAASTVYTTIKSVASTTVNQKTKLSFAFKGNNANGTGTTEQAYLEDTGIFYSKFASGSAAPTTSDLGAGYQVLWKNTTDGSIKWYVNDGGVIKAGAAFN